MTKRHDWTRDEVLALFEQPFHDLLFAAQQTHRAHHESGAIQVSALLSIKTGACPEDCGYCPQSAHHDTELERERLLAVDEVLAAARKARDAGATRFCMGAAWRSPRDGDIALVADMVREVKELGLETCLTLGMLSDAQARALRDAGLDYYNHNLDTSPEYYPEVITTRGYDDRLQTLTAVREAGLAVCCGGIVGMGESRADRAGLLQQLANLPSHPESVPINHLVKVPGTPLADAPDLDPFELVRTVAVARILMPDSVVRLSAGREQMSDELQALCFLAGANSVFHGERLLTTPNASPDRDAALFARLDLHAQAEHEHAHSGGTDRGPLLYGNACASGRAAPGTV
ncbi:MAG: biotin synthase BioB [Gammaproteobacteria bacterium]|nr:biotin synthase BioB [Gammaproteobacteria bacterium]